MHQQKPCIKMAWDGAKNPIQPHWPHPTHQFSELIGTMARDVSQFPVCSKVSRLSLHMQSDHPRRHLVLKAPNSFGGMKIMVKNILEILLPLVGLPLPKKRKAAKCFPSRQNLAKLLGLKLNGYGLIKHVPNMQLWNILSPGILFAAFNFHIPSLDQTK